MAERVAEADEAGDELGVEDRFRQAAGVAEAEEQLLPRREGDDLLAGLGQRLPEIVEVDTGQRVDDEDLVGGRDLDQTKLRLIGRFADELGVEADDRRRGDRRDGFRQALGVSTKVVS